MAGRPGRVALFRIAGIPVVLDWTWFVIVILLAWSLARSYYPGRVPHAPLVAFWLAGVVSALALFASVLLHELAHSLVARRYGLPVGSITLFIFGGISELAAEPEAAGAELRMAAAGPLTSLVLGAVCGAVGLLLPAGLVRSALGYLALVNGLLAVFNLIPGFPLDGGRVLRALLWKAGHDRERATRIAARLGQILALLLIGFGFVEILLGRLLNGVWFIIIGLFLKPAAESGYEQARLRRVLAGVTVDSIMRRDVVTVSPTLPVDRLVDDFFLRQHYHCFPVVHEGELLGLVTLANVKAVARPLWPRTKVVSIMTPIREAPVLAPGTPAVDALARMVHDGVGRFPVVDGHQLLGIISRKDIIQILKIRTDLGSGRAS